MSWGLRDTRHERAGRLVRDRLPSPTATVLEVGAGSGTARAYLPEGVDYLGLERRRYSTTRPHGPVVVSNYLDPAEGAPRPADVVMVADLARYGGGDANTVTKFVQRSLTSTGVAFFTWKARLGATAFSDLLRKYFLEFDMWTDGTWVLAECRKPWRAV